MSTTTDMPPGKTVGPSLGRLRINFTSHWTGIAILIGTTAFMVNTQSSYHVFIYDSVLLACIGALSIQLLQGTAGLVSIGSAGFLAVGAYTTVFLTRQGVPYPLDVILSAVIAGVAGLCVGLTAFRLRALFLALATLSAHFIFVFIGQRYQRHVPEAQFSGFSLDSMFQDSGLEVAPRLAAWLLLVVVCLVLLCTSFLMKNRSGRAMRTLRDHELIAPTLGIPIGRYKLLLFAFSSALFGLQGSLTAHLTGSVLTENFTVLLGFSYVVMIVVGGLDSLAGAVIGAAVVVALPNIIPAVTRGLLGSGSAAANGPDYSLIIYGILVVIFTTVSAGGIVGWFRGARFPLARRRGSVGEEVK